MAPEPLHTEAQQNSSRAAAARQSVAPRQRSHDEQW